MTETRESINMLQKLTCGDGGNNFPEKHRLPEKLELSLGLSLNGRFGFDPKKLVADDNDNNKLSRCSSVIDFDFPVDLELSLNSTISRTCSLPAPESAAEWRKRKEVQSLRRSEAKRKRVEKLKNTKAVKEYQRKVSPTPSPSPSPATPVRFSSQGSVGSLGSGGSSGVSDLDSQPFSGTNRNTTECNEINKAQCNPKIKSNVQCAIDQTMPCVTTKDEGPDGKRIQGFLYRYGKGEEVRIVCVCHGNFLTPAEFVKHGGGGDVEHPLRHIVVTNSLFS
ncbi:ninja-family protein AFP3-like [Rutidosis leptorrhynchoides]|uniref:ninja-family protein AFP3-like n=1 Tax=Rutidosis leptorrhynchoides TaxID=125765 RepID=UPI003A9A1C9C